MKPNRFVLVATLLCFSILVFSQRNNSSVLLKTGAFQAETNLRQSFLDSFNTRAARFHSKTFAILQFQSIPSQETLKALSASGVELLDYIPNNSYTVTVTGNLNLNILRLAKVKSIIRLAPEQKMEAHLAQGVIPSWAVKIAGTADIWISFPKSFSAAEVINELKQLNIDVLSAKYQSYHILSLRIAANRLNELASLPFVEYLQPAPSEDQPLNNNSRDASRADFLNASIA